MNNTLFLFFLLSVFGNPTLSWGSLFSEETFSTEDHCVAYKTKKRLFLISSVDVVGKNCDISSEVIPEPGDLFHVEVSVPILSFESGEVERDRDVAKILKVEDQKNLDFHSESLTLKEWKQKIESRKFDLKGTLKIAGKDFPVTAKIEVTENNDNKLVVQGLISSKFKDFNLKPPRLWGGIGARVSKDLNLLFQLQPTKTLGSSFLLGD